MGLRTEGTQANSTIKAIVRDVPVCGLHDDLAQVKSRITGDWNICVVVDSKRVVLGLLDMSLLTDLGTIEDSMKPAPRTLRPSVPLVEASNFFDQSGLLFALVTKSTGELMGAIRKADLKVAT